MVRLVNRGPAPFDITLYHTVHCEVAGACGCQKDRTSRLARVGRARQLARVDVDVLLPASLSIPPFGQLDVDEPVLAVPNVVEGLRRGLLTTLPVVSSAGPPRSRSRRSTTATEA